MTRYYEETPDPCGQDRMGEHWVDETLGKDGLCPGGQRRELTGVVVEWCESHEAPGWNGAMGFCLVAGLGGADGSHCRLVSAAIVPLEEPADG